MYNKFVRVVALALTIVLTMSVSVFAGTDISDNYASSTTIYNAAKDAIADSENQNATVRYYLDRASTFLPNDRAALVKDGYLLPAEAPAALTANRKAVLDLLVADGIVYEDLIKTMTIRVPANYSLDYATLVMDRTTLALIRDYGFTDLVFENDLFSVRLSMVDYLPTVPTTVEKIKIFAGETRADVPQKVLDKAAAMPILAFREYHDGVEVHNDYSKSAVAIIVKSAMYDVADRSPVENMFFKYDLASDKVSSVENYIYSNETDTASFAVEDGNYFLFLPKEATAVKPVTPGGSTVRPTTKSGYSDVADEHWASESIRKLSLLGVVSGVGNGLFEPESFVTREQFAKLLAVGFDMPGASDAPFTDVPVSDWAHPFISRVYAKGVTKGIGGNLFGYGQQITRQDMAVMIYKVLSANGGLDDVKSDGFTFADDASIADYAREAVYAMRAKGIINGNPDGTFCPNDSATRAQAAKMLCAAMGI